MDASNEERSITKHIKAQQIQPNLTKSLPVFYRNVEEALNRRRATQSLFSIVNSNWQNNDAIDFCSNDYLSWNTTGVIRKSFLDELSRYPDFSVAAGGSRVMGGNYPYIEETELEIARYHGAEQGLIVNSAFDANVMVWSALPRPGDAIVYDSLVHASTHDGMERSLAIQRIEFQHSNTVAFRNTLISILDTQPMIKQGRRSILVAVESVYSMEGDVCPLFELVKIADEVSGGLGNIQFIVDETQSAGVIGPNGTGLVCELSMEADIAVRIHTYSKAMGACGGIILSNEIVKNALINFARSTIYSAAPPFPFVAAIRAGHRLLGTPEALKGQESVQSLVRTFFETLTSHPLWLTAQKKALIHVPLASGWEGRPFFTHIVTVWTRQNYLYWIYMHLLSTSFSVLPVKPPLVPSGEGRLRVTFHAGNTTAQVVGLVEQVFVWVKEIMAIEEDNTGEKVTKAAGEVYAWMKREGLSGFGMI